MAGKVRCQVCGRTPRELEEEFDREPVIYEVDGVDMCEKCDKEYKAGLGKTDTGEESADTGERASPTEKWQRRIMS